MKHSAWLQNRSPAHVLEGKTPYEVRYNKKPHLAGIQEFGVAVYVKDLQASKLDSRAHQGQFFGYDSESKGYYIYWLAKHTISIERNVTFNEKDTHFMETTIISGDVLAEGEKEKVIQSSQTGITQQQPNLPISQFTPDHPQDEEVPQPMPQASKEQGETFEDEPQLRRGVRPRKPEGAYRLMHKGQSATLANESRHEGEDQINFALAAPMEWAMLTLDEAL